MPAINSSAAFMISCFLRPIRGLGSAGIFFARILLTLRPNVKLFRETQRQIYFIGVRSLVIIMTCGFFVGMVLALQGYKSLATFGATNAVGTMLGLSLFRELGPVLTALLFAGRAGTAVAAEIGLMRTTQQIMAMELMAIDPVARVIAPRFLAGLISVPLLTGVFNLMAIVGGVVFAVHMRGIDSGLFWGNMQAHVHFFSDYASGIWKSAAFGGAASLAAVYAGYKAAPTGEGVGSATTSAVVNSAIIVLILDFAITAMLP